MPRVSVGHLGRFRGARHGPCDNFNRNLGVSADFANVCATVAFTWLKRSGQVAWPQGGAWHGPILGGNRDGIACPHSEATAIGFDTRVNCPQWDNKRNFTHWWAALGRGAERIAPTAGTAQRRLLGVADWVAGGNCRRHAQPIWLCDDN